MSSLDLSQSILSAAADYEAGPFSAGASADLTIHGTAQLKRGVNLGVGIGVMGALDAAFRYFLAADVEVRAQASAALKGQLQVPMDLFSEAGVALRLQAAAQAGVSARLAIGLNMGDFIALAEQDPRIQGVPAKLLRIFLEEVEVQGGVLVRAAVAAKAYVNVSISGRLLPDTSVANPAPEGFTIAGEMGAGFKGGVGWQVFANLGLRDTRRMIRRSVDVAVDEAVLQASEFVDDEQMLAVLATLRAPAKMALRTGFELGLTLAEQSDLFADAGPELARRAVVVLLEEAQRFLLRLLMDLATETFQAALDHLGASPEVWDETEPQRLHLASTLAAPPPDPFDLSTEAVAYWLSVVDGSVSVAVGLGGSEDSGAEWVEPVAIAWSAVQLLLSGMQRLNNGSARVSFLGQFSAGVKTPAFSGTLAGPPAPGVVAAHVRGSLGLADGVTLTQDHLVEYLARDVLIERLVDAVPEAGVFLEIIAGPQSSGLVAAAKVVLGNLGAFVPDPQDPSSFDPVASLEVLAGGLQAYLHARIDGELAPYLHEALGDRPDLKLYVDDVLLATLRFTVGTVLERVVSWSSGDVLGREALRDACSSIVMKLLGRSLVVSTDVLLATAMDQVSGELTTLADHVDDPGGIAQGLADTGLDREVVAELMEETLRVAADAFAPLPDGTRAKIRDLLYEAVDTLPAGDGEDFLEQLRHQFFIPNLGAVTELGEELGGLLVDLLTRFTQRVLARIGEIVLAELSALVGEGAAMVQAWVEELAALVADLYDRLLALPGQIAELVDAAAALLDDALGELEHILAVTSGPTGRTALRTTLRDHVYGVGLAVLAQVPGYQLLNSGSRSTARSALKSAVGTAIDAPVLDPVLDAVGDIAAVAGEVVAELRAIAEGLGSVDPEGNVTQQVGDLLLDRIADRVRDHLGNNLTIPLKVEFTLKVKPPKVWGITHWVRNRYGIWEPRFGWVQPPSIDETLTFDLGSVSLPLDPIVAVVRQAISGLAIFEDAARDVASALLDHLQALVAVVAHEAELASVTAAHPKAHQQLVDSATPASGVNLGVVKPKQGELFDHDVQVEVGLWGVPASFLGLGDLEQERLLVWLNQESIDPERFEVVVRQPAPDLSKPGQASAPADALGSLLGPGATGPGAGGAAGGSLANLAGPGVYTAKMVSAWGEPMAADGTAARATGGLSVLRGPADAGQGHTASTGSATGAAKAQALGTAANLGVATPAGVAVRFVVPLEELREGPNSLHAALVDGDGLRVERTVVFLAAAPEEAAPGGNMLVVKPLGPIQWHQTELLKALVPRTPGGRVDDRTPPPEEPQERQERRPMVSESPFWIAPRAERQRAVALARDAMRTRVAQPARSLAAAREVIRAGHLRPVPLVRDATGTWEPLPPRAREARPDTLRRPQPPRAPEPPRGPEAPRPQVDVRAVRPPPEPDHRRQPDGGRTRTDRPEDRP